MTSLSSFNRSEAVRSLQRKLLQPQHTQDGYSIALECGHLDRTGQCCTTIDLRRVPYFVSKTEELLSLQ